MVYTKICPICKKEFKTPFKKVIRCGRKCYSDWRRGQKRPEISERNKRWAKEGKHPFQNKTAETKAKISKSREGMKLSKEHKESISEGLKRAYSNGRKAWNYKDGKVKHYKTNFRRKIRYEIYERDNYTCKKCGSQEQLVAHHLDDDTSNNESKNLVTLCRSCHARLHIGKQGKE